MVVSKTVNIIIRQDTGYFIGLAGSKSGYKCEVLLSGTGQSATIASEGNALSPGQTKRTFEAGTCSTLTMRPRSYPRPLERVNFTQKPSR